MCQAAELDDGTDLLARFEEENSKPELQAAFERVTTQVQSMGYNVKRVPYLQRAA
jgi:hypothetical protein